MGSQLEQLKLTLSGLSATDRAELARYLLGTLAPEEGVRAEWLALAERRMADVRAGRVAGIPAEDVLRILRAPGR